MCFHLECTPGMERWPSIGIGVAGKSCFFLTQHLTLLFLIVLNSILPPILPTGIHNFAFFATLPSFSHKSSQGTLCFRCSVGVGTLTLWCSQVQ